METVEMCLFLFVVILISVCFLRYDQSSKLLKDMLKLELEMNQLANNTTLALRKIDEKMTSLDQLANKTTLALRKIDEKMTSLDQLANKTTLALRKNDDKITSLDQLEDQTHLALREFDDLNQKQDAKLKEMTDLGKALEAQALKAPVAFVVHTVSDIDARLNTQLRFRDTVTNTGGAYDTSSGYFTAPVSGTYWFSVQSSPQHSNARIQIYAENTLIGNSYMYNSDRSSAYTCSTTSAVAVLNVGDKVCVKAAGVVTRAYIKNDAYRWSVFSGALVH